MKNVLVSLYLLIMLLAPASYAQAMQSHAQIIDTVNTFVNSQTRGLQGKTTFQVTPPDPRLALPACKKLEAFLSPGVQLNGNTNVGVRCNSQQGWTIFLPVTVRTTSSVLTLKRTLHAGQTVTADDLGALASDSVQAGSLTQADEAIGKMMKYGVGAGQILRYDMLRAPYTVHLGQTVQLRVKGGGFSVTSEALSLGNAAEGETTSARTPSGQIVSGVARRGGIEIIQ